MGQMIDISSRITNELPMVKITDEIIATVNNRKSVILNIQLLVKEQEKKAMESEEYDEMAFMDKILAMLIPAKVAKAINDLDLPLPEYKIVYEAIMEAATGQSQSTPI